MAVADILDWLGLLVELFNKLAFIAVSVYFGSLAFKGWKGRKNLLFSIVSIGFLGMLCFFGGLTLREIFGFNFFLSDYLFSIVMAIILYLILTLVSTGFKVTDNYITKHDLSAISEDVRQLKIQVARITKALEDKNMVPAPLTEDNLKRALHASFEKAGIKNYKLLKYEKQGDVWFCSISSNKGNENIFVDAFTGSIVKREEAFNFFSFLFKNPLSTIGFALLISFLVFLYLNTSLSTINAVYQAFDFSFLFPSPLPAGCVDAASTIENFASTEISVSADNSLVSAALPAGTYLVQSMTKGVSVNATTYYIATAYTSQVSNLGTVLTPSTLNNIYNVRVCVLKQDYTLCECIGNKQTDPVITLPYLVSLGVVEQALQNAILGSLAGAFGGFSG